MMTLTRSVLGAGRPDSKSSVLYDAPGPHTRRRHLAVAVGFSVLLVAVAVLVLVILGENDQLSESKWHPFVVGTTWTTYILPGLWGTLNAAVISIVLAFVIGTALGIGRLSDRQAVRVISGTIVELFRAVPVLILMIFTYFAFAMYGLFPSKHLALAAVVTGLTLYNGSVIAEILRSGIRALPAGQAEAAAALGLSGMQTTRIILLPQAVTTMLPALISQMVIALKDSALGYQIGYIEVVRSGVQSASYYRNYFAALIVVAAIMITINVLLTAAASRLERTLRQRRRRTASEPVG